MKGKENLSGEIFEGKTFGRAKVNIKVTCIIERWVVQVE